MVATAGTRLGGSPGRRRNQSVEAVVVSRGEVGASCDEFAHDFGVADDRGVHERGDAVRVALVHLGARLEDDVQYGERAVGGRRHQRRHRRLVMVESVDGLALLLCQHEQHPHLRVAV